LVNRIHGKRPLKAKVARRFQVTIPEEVREEVGINVGDLVDVRSQEGRVVIEKMGKNWDEVMRETKGAWSSHPAFAGMKDSVEITHWLRNKRAGR
jgi:AbrB family looped-hinge helix DNA binding protein